MANRYSRGRGRPKGHPKTGGRKAGTPNKVTIEAREAAAEIVDSAAYRRQLAARARRGELASGMEALLWYYAKGRPSDGTYSTEQVAGLLRAITALFLEVVPDERQRREFALGLKRKAGTDAGMLDAQPALPAVQPEEWLIL